MDDIVYFCFVYAASYVPFLVGYVLADWKGHKGLARIMAFGLLLIAIGWCL